jgi:hypothetical protein
MSTRILVGVTIAGGVALGLAGWRAQQTENARMHQELASLARSRAEQSSAASAQEDVRRKPACVAAPIAAAEAPPEAAPGPAPSAAAPPPRRLEPAEVRDHYESAFVQQEEDRAWAPDASRNLSAALPKALPSGSSVSSVSCRSTMCRVEMVHASLDQYAEFTRHAFYDPASPVWTGPGFSTVLEEPGAGGKLVTVVFLARPGSTLPVPTGG